MALSTFYTIFVRGFRLQTNMIKNYFAAGNTIPGIRTLFYSVAIPALLLLFSCGTSKQAFYFKTLQKKDTTIKNFVTSDFESKIVKGDKLGIEVTSLSPEEDKLFNQAASATTSGGFLVRQDGTVLLHRLGYTPVEGLTRKELALKLQTDLLPYMKDPIVNVNYLNHKVTVLGEIAKPQVIPMTEEPMNIIDVLVQSGDVTPNAKRDNIMIIRGEGNDKKVKHINLEDHSIFTSPWYYVQPNDIVYVFPDTKKALKEENRKKIQTTLSLVASGISLVIIILSRVIK
jgi:polysaccharide export outer membrane protein